MSKSDEAPQRKKKGRPSKKESENSTVEKIPKKRGRKPKGGKIISNICHYSFSSSVTA